MHTLADVRQFISQCFKELGAGFHPDTPFNDYIKASTGELTYTAAEALYREEKMGHAMDWCDENGIDIYDLAVTCMASPESFDQMTDMLIQATEISAMGNTMGGITPYEFI